VPLPKQSPKTPDPTKQKNPVKKPKKPQPGKPNKLPKPQKVG